MSAPTHLLVGLGNPGADAARHRHNVGFKTLDTIAARYGFGAFRARNRFQADVAEGRIDGGAVLGLKPQTYMNESGRAVGAAVRFYRLEPGAVIVLHDEIDLAAGKVRAKLGGGIAGHNGLRSIRAHIGADFWRVRIGVGHPGDKDRVHGHVLSAFDKADDEWLPKTLDAIADAIPQLMAGEAADFMSRVALLVQPPKQRQAKAEGSKPEDRADGV